jgi:hypothetical protein
VALASGRERVYARGVGERLAAADYDDLVSEEIDELPEEALLALDEVFVRVEARPPREALQPAEDGVRRLVLYREDALARARTLDELRELVQAELAEALVDQLRVDPALLGLVAPAR